MSKLRRRVDEILADMGRQIATLEQVVTSSSSERFTALSSSSSPDELARAWELERGFEVVQNYVAELASLAVELIGLRAKRARRGIELDLIGLRDRGHLERDVVERLTHCQAVRNTLAHEYEQTDPADLYRAAELLLGVIPHFLGALEKLLAERI